MKISRHDHKKLRKHLVSLTSLSNFYSRKAREAYDPDNRAYPNEKYRAECKEERTRLMGIVRRIKNIINIVDRDLKDNPPPRKMTPSRRRRNR